MREEIGKKIEFKLTDDKVLPSGLTTQENYYQVHKFYNRYKNPDPTLNMIDQRSTPSISMKQWRCWQIIPA